MPDSNQAHRAPPRISFGIIVLNGEPFTRHTLRALYPFASEIIVAEGASEGARAIARPDGHSRDGTLDVLQAFKRNEDPEGKVQVVTAEDEGHPSGFWPGEKHEQSQAYAKRATGDYLWQVDIDEFYLPGAMAEVARMLREQPDISGVAFHQVSFWGGIDYHADGWYLRREARQIYRVFRWGDGYSYTTHRPPTVVDPEGRPVTEKRFVYGEEMAARGIYLLHYHMVFPKQVREKMDYYERADWATEAKSTVKWAEDAFFRLRRPFRVHNVYQLPSWLERYRGTHPEQVLAMMEEGHAAGTTRATDDIDHLVDAPWYRIGCSVLSLAEPWEPRARRFLVRLKRLLAG